MSRSVRRLRASVSMVLGLWDSSVFNVGLCICNIFCFSLSVMSVLALRIEFTRTLLDFSSRGSVRC